MERWISKVAVVTGASSGIGLAIAKSLLESGMVVVGLARRPELIEERLGGIQSSGKLHAKKCDLSVEEEVKSVFAWIKDTLGGVQVLVNNAGMVKQKGILDVASEDMKQVIDVNLMGALYAIREAANLMRQNDEEAVVINISSILGHTIPAHNEYNVYPATKFAVRAISEICRKELRKFNNIRVSNVSPGLVATKIFKTAGVVPTEANKDLPFLYAEDIASSVLHIISAPKHVNITELTILPTGQVV